MALVVSLLVLPFVLTAVLTPQLSKALIDHGAERVNYAGKSVPTAAGLSAVVAASAGSVLVMLFRVPLRVPAAVFLLTFVGAATLGLLDDLAGSDETKGFKGHLRMLFRGRVTTGAVKALGGGILALAASLYFSRGAAEFVVNAGVIALCINAINLTDLRPGRAGKVFLLASGVLLAYSFSRAVVPSFTLVMVPVFSSVLAFLPFDLSEKAMLGDTGAGALGASLGVGTVCLLPFGIRVVILVLLIGLHLFTEKFSLTKTISKVRLLRYLDEWGRLQ